MIQRIQTVFLIAVVLCLGAYLVISTWQSAPADEPTRLFAFYLMKLVDGEPQKIVLPYVISGALGSIAIIVAVIEIFSFKNRIFQMKLGLLNTLLIFLSVGSEFFFIYQLDQSLQGTIDFGLFFPVSAIIFNRFAGRYIKKDEDLVRSVDRLR